MYMRVKGEAEDEIKKKEGLRNSIILKPGLLVNRKDARCGEKIMSYVPFLSKVDAGQVGVYAMGISDQVGSIALGKKANVFITREIPSYAFIPYSFCDNVVETAILNGKIQ